MEHTGEHAVPSAACDGISNGGRNTQTATEESWRAREILRLLSVIGTLRQEVAAGAAAREDLRRINEEYAARVGRIRLLEEVERDRSVELHALRDEAARMAATCEELRDELARSEQRSAESAAASNAVLASERSDRDAADAAMVARAATMQADLESKARLLHDADAVAAEASQRHEALLAKATALEAENETFRRWRRMVEASPWWRFASLFRTPAGP